MSEQQGLDFARALARESAARTGRDWLGVLGKMNEGLVALVSHPMVAGDPECVDILASMAGAAGDMPRFAVLVDALRARCGVLLVERGVDSAEVEDLLSGRPRGRTVAARFAVGSDAGGSRSRLRL